MSRKENETVVNRFLLSTLYFVVFEFGLYMLNKSLGSPGLFLHYSAILITIAIAGGIGAVLFAVLIPCKVVSLSTGIYYTVIFALIAFTGIFVKFYYLLPETIAYKLMSVPLRCKLVGLVALVLYVYEIIRYFLFVNK